MRFFCYVYLLLVIVLFFCFNGGVPAFRDGVHFYRPLFLYFCEEVSFGRFPLWNPYENLGQPFAANPTSLCFYPITILAVFATVIGVDCDLSYSLSVMFHVLLAVFTCYRFIRINCMSRGAGVFAGLSYALGGAVIFQWNNLPFLIGAAWLPEALRQAKIIIDGNYYSCRGKVSHSYFEGNEFLYKKSCGVHINIIIFAITLSMIILGGDPQTAYNVIICVGIIFLFSCKYCIRTIIYFLLAGVFAFMFSAIQILPATEFWQLSDRTLSQHSGLVDHFVFHPLRITEFLFTGIGGKLFPINAGFYAALLNDKNLWTPSTYIGLLPAAFAFCAIISFVITIITAFNRRRIIAVKRYKFMFSFFVILIIFLLGSFGNDFLIYRLLRSLPAYSSFRYPSKLLTFAVFAISFFAAVGFDTFRVNKCFAKFIVVTMRIIVTIYVVFTIFILFNGFMQFAAHPLFGSFDGGVAKSNLVYSVIIVTIIWILLECIYRYNFINSANKFGFGFRRCVVSLLLIIILTVDLFVVNSWLMVSLPFGHNLSNLNVLDLVDKDSRLNVTKNHSCQSAEFLNQKQDVDAANKSDCGRVAPIRVYRIRSLGYPFRFKSDSSLSRFAEIIRWEALTLYPRYSLLSRVCVIDVRGTMMHKDYYLAMSQVAAECKAAEGNEATGLFERHLGLLGVEYIIAGGDSFVGNNNFCADKLNIDWGKIKVGVDGVEDKFFDDVSVWRLRKLGLCDYVEYEPNRIVFDVEVFGEREEVVIAEQYWSGWRAFDGEAETPVKVVRKIFRAVELPKGKHRITMIYDPPLIKIGILITLTGILIAIIYLLYIKIGFRYKKYRNYSVV
ncbi:MAG: YfhO family protein [Planctomycetaceae bacterium]|jgi:hypothetical protein|nr:YfhO family protein [Planctomycetaceae bacterium]